MAATIPRDCVLRRRGEEDRHTEGPREDVGGARRPRAREGGLRATSLGRQPPELQLHSSLRGNPPLPPLQGPCCAA